MRVFVVLGIALLGAGCASSSSAPTSAHRADPPHPAHLFVAQLPYVGTVFWRANCPGTKQSLGIRADPNGQSGNARYRAGGFTRHRDLEPGNPTMWFPCRRARVQWLAADAGGENGLVIGAVRIDFGNFREAYSPPRVTVEVYPRRGWGGPGTENVLPRLTR